MSNFRWLRALTASALALGCGAAAPAAAQAGWITSIEASRPLNWFSFEETTGDTFADLAVGVPGEGISASGAFREHAGAVQVWHGSALRLTASDDGATAVDEDDQFWHQDRTDVTDTNERHDHFGGGRVAQ